EERDAARETAERDRAEQTALMRSLLDSMADGVVVADERGEWVICNPAGERLLGQSGQAAVRLFRPDGGTPLPGGDRPTIRALVGRPVHDEIVLETPTSSKRLVLNVSAAPVRDERGALRGAVAVFRDVSEMSRLLEHERQARDQAERLRGAALALSSTRDLPE